MRFALLILLLVALPALAQEPRSAARRNAGFGSPVPEPIGISNYKAAAGLWYFLHQSQNHASNPGAITAVNGLLAEAAIGGVSLADTPKDAWAEKHHPFVVKSANVESGTVGPGLMLIGVTGEIPGLGQEHFAKNGPSDLVPVLLQLAEDKEGPATMGVVRPAENGRPVRFEVFAKRMENADKAALIFLNRNDRSWAMYRDGTFGKPIDSLFFAKIDEKSLIAVEAARVKAEKEMAEANRKQAIKSAAEDPQKRREDNQKIDDVVAKHAAQAKAVADAKAKAEEEAKYRQWESIGAGKIEAKILRYGNGVVTLQDRSGTPIKVELTQLNEADRAAYEKWRRDRQKTAVIK
jgi:hypothetical protein